MLKHAAFASAALFLALFGCLGGDRPVTGLLSAQESPRKVPAPPIPQSSLDHLADMEFPALLKLLVEEHPAPETLHRVAYVRACRQEAVFMRALHKQWKADTASARTQRLFQRSLREGALFLNQKPAEQQLRDEIIQAGLASPETRPGLLAALADTPQLQYSPLCADVLFPEAKRAKREEYIAWSWVILQASPPRELSAEHWQLIAAAYADSLAPQTAGKTGASGNPSSDGSPENKALAFRVEAARRCEDAALAVAPGMIAAEVSAGVLDYWAAAIDGLDAGKAGAEQLARAALAADHAELRINVMQWLKGTQAAEKLAPEIRALASAHRKDIRDAARECLGAAAKDIPEPAPFMLSAKTAGEFLTLVPFDLKGARRAKAHAFQYSAWGYGKWSENKLPGWLLSPEGTTPLVFVSDEMDWTEGTAAQLKAEVTDFDAEIADAAAQLAGPRNDDSGFDTWVVGHKVHNLLRLLFLIQLDSAKGEYARSSAFYSKLIIDYNDERSLQEDLAYNLAWLHFSNAAHTHAVANDTLAAAHATRMAKLEPWTRLQSDFNSWLRDCRAILADIETRRKPYTTTDEKDVAYWIERLPDVTMRQQMQPGGIAFAGDTTVRDKVRSFGLDALMPLVAAIDRKDRLARGCGFWRDFNRSRQMVNVATVARGLMHEIIKEKLNVEPAFELYDTENRDLLLKWLNEAIAAVR